MMLSVVLPARCYINVGRWGSERDSNQSTLGSTAWHGWDLRTIVPTIYPLTPALQMTHAVFGCA